MQILSVQFIEFWQTHVATTLVKIQNIFLTPEVSAASQFPPVMGYCHSDNHGFDLHINGVMHQVLSHVRLLLLNLMCCRFIHVVCMNSSYDHYCGVFNFSRSRSGRQRPR